MSRTTREINRITTAIISISVKLLIYALVFFLMYEGVTKGYQFGHDVFSPEAISAAPGRDYSVLIKEGDSLSRVAKELEEAGLIRDRLVFMVQAKFYEYDLNPGAYVLNTSMTSKEMLQKIDEKRTVTEDGAKDNDSE